MKKALVFLPAAILYLLMFVLSSRDLGISIDKHQLDKLVHAAEFALLGYFLSLGFFAVWSAVSRLKIAAVFFLGVVLGALDEFHQAYVPGRHADPRDLLADAAGVACGIFIFWVLSRKKKRASIL